jgi:hypothetical protein
MPSPSVSVTFRVIGSTLAATAALSLSVTVVIASAFLDAREPGAALFTGILIVLIGDLAGVGASPDAA